MMECWGGSLNRVARKAHAENMTSNIALQEEEEGPCGCLREEESNHPAKLMCWK